MLTPLPTTIPSLSIDELYQLQTALTQQGGLSLFQVHGLFCALVSGPHPLPDEVWLPVLWKGNSSTEGLPFNNTLRRLYQHLQRTLPVVTSFKPFIEAF